MAGLALSRATGRFVESLLYQVLPTEPSVIALLSLAILATAILASLPAVGRALAVDPVALLKAD